MHAVDGDELFGERVGDAVLVNVGAGDAADELAPGEPAEEVVDLFAGEAPPVGAHADL